MRKWINLIEGIIGERVRSDILLVNPTAREVEQHTHREDLRGLAYDNNVVFWSALDDVHHIMRSRLELSWDTTVSLYVSTETKADWDEHDTQGINGRGDWVDPSYLYGRIRSVYCYVDPEEWDMIGHNLALGKLLSRSKK